MEPKKDYLFSSKNIPRIQIQKLLMYTIVNILGKPCKITTNSGLIYTGFLESYTSKGVIIYTSKNQLEKKRLLLILIPDIVSIEINSITKRHKFQTDREISKKSKNFKRKLQE